MNSSEPDSSQKLLHIKVTPDLHLTYSKKWGKPGVGIENEIYSLYLNFIDIACIAIYSLYLNFIDKTCKIYLFIFI